jgi:hypothetical protein
MAKIKFTKEQRRDIDSSINYLIKEGYLDEDRAREMKTYKEKQEYLSWSESRAEAEADRQKEEGND